MRRIIGPWRLLVCLWLVFWALALGGCSSDSPTEPSGDEFITLDTLDGSRSLPADGLSTVALVAKIDARGVEKGRAIRFQVDRGTLMAPGETAGQSVDVVPDSSGSAVVIYRSGTTTGPLIVIATVVETSGMTVTETQVSTRLALELTGTDGDRVIRFTQAPATAPADGATSLRFVVQAAPEVDGTTEMVTFTTTAGSFTRATAPVVTTTRPLDDAGRSSVLLYATNEITEATVTAAVRGHTAETRIRFVRADAEEILVEVSPFRLEPDGMTTVTARLIRDVGKPTADAVVRFAREDSDGESFGTFRNIMRSNADGVATAVLHREKTGVDGRGRVIVTVDGSSAVGTTEIELVEEPSSGGGSGGSGS